MAKKQKLPADNTSMTKEELEERKKFYKILLSSMSLEEKLDELGYELSDEDLAVLLKQFEEDEDYEICQAFKILLEERKSKNSD